jgi:exonuclease VII large subunit
MKIRGKSIALCPRAIAIVLVFPCLSAAAQTGCLSGPLKTPVGAVGTVEVCPEYSAKVPELQNQLLQMQQTLNGNQALMREVARASRNINALSRDVDENRKNELLRSFTRQLKELAAADQAKTQSQLSDLNEKLDNLKDQIT